MKEKTKKNKYEFPMKVKDAKIVLKEFLNPLEQIELKEVEEVYFLNIFERKAELKVPDGAENFGYDNENGEYLY